MAEFFEHLTEKSISTMVNWLAVVTVIAGPLVGLIVGKLRRLLVHDLLHGVLWGLSGPALAFLWMLVDTRTSWYDYLYRAQNPENERMLWKVYDTIGILKPYPVDSVYGLGTLALGVVIAGGAIGVILAYATRSIDRSFGPKVATEPRPEATDAPSR